MATPDLDVAVAAIRAEVEDTGAGASAFAVDADLRGGRDNTNVRFTLPFFPAVAAGFELRRLDGSGVTLLTKVTSNPAANEYTLDPDTGIVTLGSAPSGLTVKHQATYYYLWFADSEYWKWIIDACRWCGFPPTAAYSAGSEDDGATSGLAIIPDGMLPAMYKYAQHLHWNRRAAAWASRFSSSTGGVSTGGVDDVGNKFRELARDALKAAESMRSDPYEGFDRRQIPTAARAGFQGFGRFQPRR
ncbi:MAG TPA: hypothetical protein VNI57_01470 [Candidatus Saccharimonadales bacterium]|nr:hypothetical protein [Candidatus Saccharimonadales bacterium]